MNKTRCLSFLFNIKSPWTVTGTMGEYLLVLGHQGDGLSAGGFVVLWSFPVWHVPGRALVFTLRSCVYSPALLFVLVCHNVLQERQTGEATNSVIRRGTAEFRRTGRQDAATAPRGNGDFVLTMMSIYYKYFIKLHMRWEMSLQKRKGVVLICAERWRHWVSKQCPSSSTPLF